MTQRSAAYERAVAFLHAIEERGATRKETWTWGTGYFHDDYPTKWDLNYLRLERRPGPSEVSAVVAEAERVFEDNGLAHRKIHDDDPAGAHLAAAFQGARWSVETIEVMKLDGDVHGRADLLVEEVDGARIRVSTREWYRQTLVVTEDQAANLADSIAAVERAVRTRYFGVRVRGGIASWCHLYQQGEVAQIEEVSTFEPFRGRGYATATVLRAIHEARAAGASFIFLVADAHDWPRDMYARLGFRPIGRIYDYSKLPPA